MKNIFLYFILVTVFWSTTESQAISITATYSYDDINRLTNVVYSSGMNTAYTYDPAGNITKTTASLPPTLTDAIHYMQVLTGSNLTQGISASKDINGDNRVGLPEAIDALKKISQ